MMMKPNNASVPANNIYLSDNDDLRPSPMAPSNPELDLSSPSSIIFGIRLNNTLTTRLCSAPKSSCLRHSSSILCHHSNNLASLAELHNKKHNKHSNSLASLVELHKEKHNKHLVLTRNVANKYIPEIQLLNLSSLLKLCALQTILPCKNVMLYQETALQYGKNLW